VIIQTVGMNAAAYMIVLNKSHLLDFNLIATFTVVGIPGVLTGLALNLAPFYVVLTFQILVLEFAFIFFYLNVLAPRSSPSAVPTPPTPRMGPTPGVDPTDGSNAEERPVSPVDIEAQPHKKAADEQENSGLAELLTTSTMWMAAFAGGFLTANVGSGSDIMLYAYGLLGWNLLVPESRRLSDTQLTASSVVVMGLLSLVTTVCRAFTGGMNENVLFCWGATCWLVCFGAPLGSLLLTPGLRAQLRIAFYILAIAQFIGFAVLTIRGNVNAWTIFAIITVIIFAFLVLHLFVSKASMRKRGVQYEPFSPGTFKKRLIT